MRIIYYFLVQITSYYSIELFLLFSTSPFFNFFEYSWIGYAITINVASTADIDGIKIIVYRMKLFSYSDKSARFYFEYAAVLPMKNIASPDEILSRRL